MDPIGSFTTPVRVRTDRERSAESRSQNCRVIRSSAGVQCPRTRRFWDCIAGTSSGRRNDMRSSRVIARAAFILLCSVALGQQEKTGYFSLNSSRTYAPGQKVSIDMWAQNVDTLEFRVYRVNDPVKFFAQLGDAHQFGGRAPRPPHKLTWLERFHNWKHSIFVWIRDFFRAQFTAENRATIREQRSQAQQQPQGPAEVFAQIPILNSQQLVATWRQNVGSREYRWETESVAIPVKDRGAYLIEATDGKLRAYTIVVVSQMAL